MESKLLEFLKHLLSDTLSIDFQYYTEPYTDIETIDRSFRKWMSYEGSGSIYKYFLELFTWLEHNSFHVVQDEFLLNYILFFPYEDKKDIVSLGPYRSMLYTQAYLKAVAESSHLSKDAMDSVKSFLFRVPEFVDNQRLISTASHVLAYLNPTAKAFQISESAQPPLEPFAQEFLPVENFEIHIGEVQARYDNESALLNAISRGDTVEALLAAQNFSNYPFDWPFDNYFQGRKILLYTINTLFRKAAEESDVHPVYLHEISSRYTRDIAAVDGLAAVTRLRERMICDYCALVREKARARYTPLIRGVINHIEFYLNTPLSLSSIARRFNISSPYLSNLFKKETGQTITDYINQQRILKAQKLLLRTNMSIQDIASSVGIQDVSYFTKLFRRTFAKAPREYRKDANASAPLPTETSD